MEFMGFLILFPFLAAVILACTKNDGVRKVVVYTSSAVIIAVAIYFSVTRLVSGQAVSYLESTEIIDIIMLCGEVFLMILIVVLSFKHKRLFPALLSIVQTGFILWFELFSDRSGVSEATHLFCDRLTVVMCLIVAVIGSLICVYAVGYLRDYHNHHTEYNDRRPFFFGMLFVFLGAMFGLIFSSNLVWIYFFWEITSVSSFLLIGYTKTDEAVTNSFRALWMNLLGGFGFCIGLIYAELVLGITTLQQLVTCGQSTVIIPVVLLAFAGLTKSAQFPFSKWLLGAMVAPTPSSALLHSATMVKAGVYLLLRLAPVMSGTWAGAMVALVGGFTFFIASVLAMTKSDGKSVLAYSTISNLGLITACAGVGAIQTVWAGVLLMIFHAVSKSLLFQTVGAVENTTGSRNIEDMNGLIKTYPALATAMGIGIAGMFLAPFGMLISKWAALKAFVDADNIILIMCLAFGSATTLFYWTKWLCKILARTPKKALPNKTSANQWCSIGAHTVMMILMCLTFPLIAKYLLQPMLADIYGKTVGTVLSRSDMLIMIFMLIAFAVIPAVGYLVTSRVKVSKSKEYIAGINTGDHENFIDSFGDRKYMNLSNWYFVNSINEKKWLYFSNWGASAIIIICGIVAIGGVL